MPARTPFHLRLCRAAAALLGAAALLAVLPACRPAAPAGTPENPFRLTYSIFFPSMHLQAQAAARWAADIEERTGRRVKIDIYAFGSLTKPEQCWQGVLSGISDIGMSCFSYTPGRFPLLEALDLPLGWPDGLSATRIATELARRYDPAETRGAKLLLVHAHGPGILATKEPVRRLDDLRDMRIRGTGLSAAIVSHLGATPVGMPQSETYDALQKGVAEGTFCPVETLKGWKQAETIRYVTDASAIGYTTAMFVAFNRDSWDRLPDDIRQTILDVTDEYVDRHGLAWNQADRDGWAFVQELHREVLTLDLAEEARWQAALAPILDDYVARAEARGLPGRAFLDDARRMIAEARAARAAAAPAPQETAP